MKNGIICCKNKASRNFKAEVTFMKEKKPVYNGYEERYATGKELSKIFEGQYLTTGRHHSVVLGLSIPDYLWFLGIDDQKIYRIFINQFFCRLMKGDTDGLISFFGHTVLSDVRLSVKLEDMRLHKFCPICGAPMKFKQGKYGEFLGCSSYPACKHTAKIPIIGNVESNMGQIIEYWKSHTKGGK